MMLKREGLLEEALAFDPWVHNFRLQVFPTRSNHAPADPADVCRRGWTCVLVLRNQYARAVSSYVHATGGVLPRVASGGNRPFGRRSS